MPEDRPTAPRPPRRIRCWLCGREKTAVPSELRRYAVTGFPRCCGADMRVVGGKATPRVPTHPDRLGRRWLARSGVRSEVRRPGSPPGPDLGAGLVDVSADGACVRVTAPVTVGEDLQVRFRRKGAKKWIEMPTGVRWCQPEGGGLFLVGLRLRRRLTPAELADLAR